MLIFIKYKGFLCYYLLTKHRGVFYDKESVTYFGIEYIIYFS